MARPAGKKPLLERRKELGFTKEDFEVIENYVKKNPGVKIATWMQDTLVDAARKAQDTAQKFAPVPALGYIHAGDAMTISHLPEGLTATPPIPLNPDCYALIVTGDSMERNYGLSIPDGSYAFFCPQSVAHFGAIVHVEWPRNDGEHECTLKKYCPNPDGTVTFEPFNKKHPSITKKQGEFVIRGIFIQSWKGEGQKQHKELL